jgi:hypothetical protein
MGSTTLVAFELKVVEYEPANLGKMQFHLEALDRDVKKPHEHLWCRLPACIK